MNKYEIIAEAVADEWIAKRVTSYADVLPLIATLSLQEQAFALGVATAVISNRAGVGGLRDFVKEVVNPHMVALGGYTYSLKPGDGGR